MKAATCALCLLMLLAAMAFGQNVISAKSGLINYTEGQALLDGKGVQIKADNFGNFPQMRDKSQLTTEDGRAEVLLSPGVFLRMGENSGITMLSNRLTDSKIQFDKGSIVLECAELSKDETVTVVYKTATVSLLKDGVYRLDSEPAQLKVYDGEARVEQNGQTQMVRKSRLLPLNGISVAEKFDNQTGDELYRWARRRAEYLAAANISAAKLAQSHSYSSYGSGYGSGYGGWYYNPYFGMYTWLPMNGLFHSFWGYQYWSPGTVWQVYAPPVYSGGGGGFHGGPRYDSSVGYNTMSHTSGYSSGTVASSAPTSAASTSSASSVSSGGGARGGGGAAGGSGGSRR